ncbi:hypothetical protein NDU88_004507 [Pleurodeles waltl]|uniref:Uncharacterized protein n=1 Tax=Pleurodeles waltl TaxID=8319 RepID=A0AAV7QFB9_PLEWA|nr:hypothetical protein NDU88_004507 [Pleurodeles waltl]
MKDRWTRDERESSWGTKTAHALNFLDPVVEGELVPAGTHILQTDEREIGGGLGDEIILPMSDAALLSQDRFHGQTEDHTPKPDACPPPPPHLPPRTDRSPPVLLYDVQP